MKIDFKITCLLIFIMTCYNLKAQVDVFEDEVTLKNSIVFYQDKPLTGTLYSSDIEDITIPNSCQCTQISHFSKGKLNGNKRLWYTNGKLRFEGKYVNGLPQDTHINYNDSGDVISKIKFNNGLPIEEINYNNDGTVKSQTPFIDGKKNGAEKGYNSKGILVYEKTYTQNRLIKTLIYNELNQVIKEENVSETHLLINKYTNNLLHSEESYFINSTIKDGDWKNYNTAGNLISEITYKKDKEISKGNYKNNLKEGDWFLFSDNFRTKKITTYKNGEVINTQVINSESFIENYPLNANDKVIAYYNEHSHKYNYYILRVKNSSNQSDSKQVENKIKKHFFKRSRLLKEADYAGEKQIKSIIEVNNISVKYSEEKYEKTKTENGIKKKYYVTGHSALINYTVVITDLNTTILDTYSYQIDSKGSFGKSILSSMTSSYPTSPNNAFLLAINNIQVYKVWSKLFPIRGEITNIKDQKSSKVKTVIINKGENDKLFKKMIFTVFDEENNDFKATLKVIDLQHNTATCKVLDNQEWLYNYLQTHTTTLITEGYNKK